MFWPAVRRIWTGATLFNGIGDRGLKPSGRLHATFCTPRHGLPQAAGWRPGVCLKPRMNDVNPSAPSTPEPRLPAIIDIEASGFGRGSYPIEVGIVMPDGSAFCSLIRPEPGWNHWDESAAATHRIERSALLLHGRGAGEVAQMLNDRLRGMTVLCDGWAHDFVWLALLFEAAGRVPLFRLDDLRSVLTPTQSAAWHDTRLAVQTEAGLARHRASSDARILQITLQRLSIDG